MPNMELLIDTISQCLTDEKTANKHIFQPSTSNTHIASYNYTRTLQNIVISVSFVQNSLVHTDLEPDFMVSQTCQLDSKKQWTTHLWAFKTQFFLDDIITDSTRSQSGHINYVIRCLKVLVINQQKLI